MWVKQGEHPNHLWGALCNSRASWYTVYRRSTKALQHISPNRAHLETIWKPNLLTWEAPTEASPAIRALWGPTKSSTLITCPVPVKPIVPVQESTTPTPSNSTNLMITIEVGPPPYQLELVTKHTTLIPQQKSSLNYQPI